MHRFYMFAVLIAAVIAIAGCTTIRSTWYGTDDCCPERYTKHLTGVPTTIEVPTHIKITVLAKRYLTVELKDAPKEMANVGAANLNLVMLEEPKKDEPKNEVPKPMPMPVSPALAIKQPKDWLRSDKIGADGKVVEAGRGKGEIVEMRRCTYDVITMKELFTVDVKRPGAGSLSFELGFNGQNLKKVKYERTDETILRSSELLASLIKTLPTLGQSTTADTPKLDTIEIETVVAVQIFDLRQPNIEERIQAFLNHYLNNCRTDCDRIEPLFLNGGTPPAGPGCVTPIVPVVNDR